jgi:antitoxin component YwqK of YwqJK toxin-antitoxin module
LEAHHEQYADKDGHNRNGVTRFYNVKGLLDSTATFKDGKMDGDAYK